MRSRGRSTGLHFFCPNGALPCQKTKRLEELSAHTHTVTVSAFGVTDIITSWKLAIYLLLHLLWQGHAPWQLFEIHMRRAKSCESIWGQLSLGSDTMVDRLSRLLPAFMMMGTFDLGQSAVCSCNMLQPLEAETCDTIPYCSWRWKHPENIGPYPNEPSLDLCYRALLWTITATFFLSGIGKNLTNDKPFGNYPGATVCNETKGVWK